MTIHVCLRKSKRETGDWFFFFLGTNRSNEAVRNARFSSRAAGTMRPVPANETEQAMAFPWLRADADVVAVVSD